MLSRSLVLLSLLLCLASAVTSSDTNETSTVISEFGVRKFTDDPDESRYGCDLALSKGYPCDEIKTVTADGYILTMFHMPRGRNRSNSTPKMSKPVVFLQHGLEASGTNWITNFPEQSLAFILADAGYDVWMGNFRGNKYSHAHTTLSPASKEFWDFSWDQMAEFDLPAMINFALNYSNQEQLFYVGHSQGTLTAFAKFSSDLEFARKIKKYFALAPIISVKHVRGGLRYLAPFSSTIGWVFELFGVNEFLPNSWLMNLLAKFVCGFHFTDKLICENICFLLCGPDVSGINQLVMSGNFQKYNYGSAAANRKHYGQDTAPLYDVTQMEVPTALFWGGHDWLGDPRDVAILVPKIKNLIGNLELPEMNHLDFIWGLKAPAEVYSVILKMMQSE